jgi:hypothetical protein
MLATPWEKLDRGTSYCGNGIPNILLKNARIAKEFPTNAACKLTPAPAPKKFSKSCRVKKGEDEIQSVEPGESLTVEQRLFSI